MAPITSFRDLSVWQKATALAVAAHRTARKFPRDEQAVLGHQIRKSAVSIPSNIAEGFSRRSTAFYIQHLWIAHASGAELQTQLEIASQIGAIEAPQSAALIADAQEIGRMIYGLVASLERSRG
jgi:four helix bundle protein